MSTPQKFMWKAWRFNEPIKVTAEQVVSGTVRDASSQHYGDLECLRVEHDRLLRIVGKLVARLPAEQVAEVCEIDPNDLEPVT